MAKTDSYVLNELYLRHCLGYDGEIPLELIKLYRRRLGSVRIQ
jgi:hypothetical protein